MSIDALFVPDGDGVLPTELARGPWDPGALHGGPTAALVVRAAERHVDGGTWQVARATIELLRPVPVEPLLVLAETVRPGRKVTLTSVSVLADSREVARAVVLSVRRIASQLPSRVTANPPPEGPDDAPPPVAAPAIAEWPAFHNQGVEMRWMAGVWRQPGPATVWMRLRVPVVAGEEPTPAMRAAAVADFGNGISSELDFGSWRFLNPELTVHLARPPIGEWIRLDARTVLGPTGAGVASSELADREGAFGRAAQALLIEPA